MKIKSAYKFQMSELSKPVLIYYIVIAALMIMVAVTQKVMDSRGFESSASGFEMATVIFLFVCGLNAFKQPFHMFMANGVSRKSGFIGTIAAFGTVSVGMALIDGLLSLVMSLFLRYETLFAQQYGTRYGWAEGSGVTVGLAAESFLWAVFCYMAAAMLGLAITTAYYRMNKPLKLAVSIGVPVLVLIVIPIVDASVFGGAITYAVMNIIAMATSILGKGNPYSMVLCNVFWILIMGGVSWLLVRRATVRTQ